VWNACKQIAEGFNGHLKKVVPQQFAKDDGTNTVSDMDNANISAAHYQKIFDRSAIASDPTVLNELSPA
jgi:hypothetical protein